MYKSGDTLDSINGSFQLRIHLTIKLLAFHSLPSTTQDIFSAVDPLSKGLPPQILEGMRSAIAFVSVFVSVANLPTCRTQDPCTTSGVKCIAGSATQCCGDGGYVACTASEWVYVSCDSLSCVPTGKGAVACATPLQAGGFCSATCCWYAGSQCYCQC